MKTLSDMENDCKRRVNGKCVIDEVCVEMCVGKDCGAYEPNSSIPPRCRNCWNYTGAYCEVHLHLIEAAARCSEWSPKDGNYPESDLSISVAHLREILEDVASSQFMPRVLNDNTIDEIIERVKKEI